MQMTGAEVMVKCLAEQGVTTVFGYPGGAILPFYDALREASGIRHILTAGRRLYSDFRSRSDQSGHGARQCFFRFDTCRSDHRSGAGGNDRTRRISGS